MASESKLPDMQMIRVTEDFGFRMSTNNYVGPGKGSLTRSHKKRGNVLPETRAKKLTQMRIIQRARGLSSNLFPIPCHLPHPCQNYRRHPTTTPLTPPHHQPPPLHSHIPPFFIANLPPMTHRLPGLQPECHHQPGPHKR